MSAPRKKIVIIGATSAIAEQCARLWSRQSPLDLVLVGRDLGKLDRMATDLRVRNPDSAVDTRQIDFNDPVAIAHLAAAVYSASPVDIVLIAHGALPDQTACQNDLKLSADALSLNGMSPVLFAEAFAGFLQQADRGILAIIGSVAGDRGRKSNYVYGAAKAMVEKYAQGLQHRLASGRAQVLLIKPGPTDTPMTSHLKAQGARLADVESVAEAIVKAIAQSRTELYTPAKWRIIMMIIRNLPSFVFNRMNI